MPQGLFRKEALEAKRMSWLGGISLTQPLPMWVLTAAATVAALLVGLFLAIGTYTRRSSVAGQLVPSKGLATVLAPATGVVSQLAVAEGGKVAAGQALAIVTVPRATVGSGDTAAALEQRLLQRQDGLMAAQQAQQQQLSAQADGLQAQLAVARRELVQIETEVVTRRHQVRIASVPFCS
jgi:membrane fusion protein